MVSYAGDSNLGDPIVAPFVTKAAQTLTINPVHGQPGTVATTPVSNAHLWGNVYGQAHGGVCSSSARCANRLSRRRSPPRRRRGSTSGSAARARCAAST